ncbi:hypothetical protein S83_071183, partial [Arachis hypogaea]
SSARYSEACELIGARLEDPVLTVVLQACPYLKRLLLLGCEGVRSISIELPYLEEWSLEVKHLFMKVEFTGDFEALQPFPEIDFVEFFNSHPKLRKFDIHGAMFAALCQRNSLKHVDPGFVIPCLEEAVVTVRSPLNAEQKISTLESLLKYGKNLRTMVIKILQMKSCHTSADDFFYEICRLRYMNHEKGLVPLPGSNNESWCQGPDGLASRSAEYYKQGARFAKWRTVVSIPCGPSALAVKEAAWGLARYAAISQDNDLIPIVEPKILLDGDHPIERTLYINVISNLCYIYRAAGKNLCYILYYFAGMMNSLLLLHLIMLLQLIQKCIVSWTNLFVMPVNQRHL